MKKITTKGIEIGVIRKDQDDYISLTDIARFKGPDTGLIISHWLSTRYTVQLMGVWEQLHNPNFNITEFSNIKNESGSNGFVLSVKTWREKAGGIGIIAKAGRYNSGTFAHRDIAFEFASWISPEFKLYLIKEFQRLKNEENERIFTGWDVKRTLTKMNYHIHTEAIKNNLVPQQLSPNEKNMIYANEADILNMAIFGMTSASWKKQNPKKGRKSSGLCESRTISSFGQLGISQCRIYKIGTRSERTTYQTQSNCHLSDESHPWDQNSCNASQSITM